MKFLHTMVRVHDLEESLNFYCDILGLKEIRRKENEAGKFTLVFLATHDGAPEVELTYNWGSEENYKTGRSWGHLAYEVENIYEYCEMLQNKGVTILRPPRDGFMAFIKSPDDVSIEILQKGNALEPQSPWNEMENVGSW
ncbi:lactoylglutathione lyase [Candidatus Gracilibacteria bacterium]|nr:lactoylglutathione lyase [Candidatus Gracilibacteria bacterium]